VGDLFNGAKKLFSDRPSSSHIEARAPLPPRQPSRSQPAPPVHPSRHSASPKGEPDYHIENDQRVRTLFAQQGPKLVAESAIGRVSRQGRSISRPNQGRSVSLSTDGNTAIIGAGGENAGFGAVWVFTRSAGAWTRQAKLVGSGAVVGRHGPRQGYSVSLSGDGNTAAVGGPGGFVFATQSAGAVWVFTRSGGRWTQQAKLVGSGAVGRAGQGVFVSLSMDGNSLIVGGSGDNHLAGAAWVFTRSGGRWTQQAKLVGAGAVDRAEYGSSVALSGDGNTAIVGAPLDGTERQDRPGAAYVYACSNGVWTQQARLIGRGPDLHSRQGSSVSLSADGNTAIVGESGCYVSGTGATWVFTRSSGVWVQEAKLLGTGAIGNATQGFSVSLSSDGNTVITGGSLDNDWVGAAWVFAGRN
jgi:hypothetical protein